MQVACAECLAEDKYFFFFCIIHNTCDFSKKMILREGEESQLGLVYTWSRCVICRIGNTSDL